MVERYLRLRRVQAALNHRVLSEWVDRGAMEAAARVLGLWERGSIVFEVEEEVNSLADVALFDVRLPDGRTPVEAFGAEAEGLSGDEREVVEAMGASWTSLFEVVDARPEVEGVLVEDLLGDGGRVVVTDRGFSRTTSPGTALFLRILPFDGLAMNSGIGFMFGESRVPRLVRRWRVERRRSALPEAQGRFRFFFRANRREGLPVEFRKPSAMGQ